MSKAGERSTHTTSHNANHLPRARSHSCGVGGPAREIARFAGIQVVGLNNNEYQVSIAQKMTSDAGLSNQVSFVKGDFMKLEEQFGPNSFDAVYAIEATCHAPSAAGIYGQIQKVLKPQGVFGVYEWCMTDIYDKSNAEHRRVAHGIEVGDGIPEMRDIKVTRAALKEVGFSIERDEDLADNDDPLPWYYPLEGDLRKCQSLWDVFTAWRMTWFGKLTTQTAVSVFERIGLAPKGTHDVGEQLKIAGDALVDGGKTKLFTPMMLFVCRKQ